MITELRILPPLVIGRFGGAPTPMDNYNAVVDPESPLAYRTLEPAETLEVDPESGEITREFVPDRLRFTEDGLVRPVAPFMEVWARRDDGELEPLTLELLQAERGSASDVRWNVRAGNLKVYRRTGEKEDRVLAGAEFADHASHALEGKCEHFWPGRTVPLGHVRYIRPTAAHPEIRLRFTPAPGYVYGSSQTPPDEARPNDPNVVSVVYDATRGKWLGHIDAGSAVTRPPRIYAGRPTPDGRWESLGYLDDGCDGIARVELPTGGRTLSATGRFGAGPPTYAPDSAPVRSVADELEQALLGPDVTGPDASPERVEEIVRRAFETVRLMNTAFLNSPGVGMDWADAGYGRRPDPIMAPSLVDDRALERLHQSLLVALRSGTSPWFGDVLRDYDEVGDLSDLGRRKMPAMMRGADGRHMTLTRRQVNLIRALAGGPVFPDAS